MSNKLYIISLGKTIKKVRKERGLSQKTLSEKVMIAQSTIVNIEKGIKGTNIDIILRICEGLSISILELLELVQKSLSEQLE